MILTELLGGLRREVTPLRYNSQVTPKGLDHKSKSAKEEPKIVFGWGSEADTWERDDWDPVT